MSDEKMNLSRRNFLTGMSGLAAGLAVGGVGTATLMAENVHASAAPQWPLPYTALDVEDVRKRGHLGYYQGKCSQGSFSAIVGSLQDKVGGPFNAIPVQLMAFGTGGVAGWCTLCGALNGACAAISLVSKNYKALTDELLKWFCQTPFPSETSNTYAVNHAFLVEKYKSDAALPQTTPGSPLCHVNVSRWCKEHGFTSGSSERSERCARTSGDVAAYAAYLLNEDLAGSFASKLGYAEEVDSCRSCHAKGKEFEVGGWTRGKMGCYDCHNLDTVKLVDMDHGK